MNDFPAPLKTYIEAYLIESQMPAYLILDTTHGLIDWGGQIDVYGLKELQYGQHLSGALAFLQELLPLQDEVRYCPRMTLQPGYVADMHLLQSEQQVWVLLLRAKAETGAYDLKQQQALKSIFDQSKRQTEDPRRYDVDLERLVNIVIDGLTAIDLYTALARRTLLASSLLPTREGFVPPG